MARKTGILIFIKSSLALTIAYCKSNMFNYVREQMKSREQIRAVKAENTTIESFQFHA